MGPQPPAWTMQLLGRVKAFSCPCNMGHMALQPNPDPFPRLFPPLEVGERRGVGRREVGMAAVSRSQAPTSLCTHAMGVERSKDPPTQQLSAQPPAWRSSALNGKTWPSLFVTSWRKRQRKQETRNQRAAETCPPHPLHRLANPKATGNAPGKQPPPSSAPSHTMSVLHRPAPLFPGQAQGGKTTSD